MKKLMEKNPVLHAVIWIMIYVVTVNIGDALSESTGTVYLTGVLLLALSAALALYLKKAGQIEANGIKRITRHDARNSMFYIPLILLAFIQFIPGIDSALSRMDIMAACILMIGTGFIEELIFRGLLFKGIKEKSGVNKAILISGVTFGMGHIVNLLRGYATIELAGQIMVAITVGIVLALLVAVTENIVPGILFHIVFNISGTITNTDSGSQVYILIAIMILSAVYAIYLMKLLRETTKTVRA